MYLIYSKSLIICSGRALCGMNASVPSWNLEALGSGAFTDITAFVCHCNGRQVEGIG